MARRATKFEDILTQPYRWPKAGDRLFAPASGGDAAEIHGDAHTRLQLMTNGYKEAADVLADAAISDPIARHTLVYPVVYSYRHYIELALKGMIAFYGSRVGVTMPGLETTHNLRLLLKSFRKVLRAYHVEDPERSYIDVSKCILDFDQLDPKSFKFRYATGRDGQPYPIRMTAFDLERLRDTMEGVENYFTTMDAYLFDLVSSATY